MKTPLQSLIVLAVTISTALLAACSEGTLGSDLDDDADVKGTTAAPRVSIWEQLSPMPFPSAPPDPTNRYADNAEAAALGQQFFFDKRFSGPLLDDDHDGGMFGSALGSKGDPGKVACASCHNPAAGFLDTRSTKQQVSLGAAWTHRRAPSLLGVGHMTSLMWDGRRDALFNQVFSPLEASAEMNSSRLFVAQQIQTHYRASYEKVFGAFPDISKFSVLDPADAGCREEQSNPSAGCAKPYDDNVTRVVVNFGKAVGAYLRKLNCGPGRFDAWVHGDKSAMNEQEVRGANLFVGKAGCVSCHSGPMFTNQGFYNIGLPEAQVSLVVHVGGDPGAEKGVSAMLADPLSSSGSFSDGKDARQASLAGRAPEELRGSFKTPSLRCVAERPSFTHTGQLRDLKSTVEFFNQGGGAPGSGYVGTKHIAPLGLSDAEVDDVVSFLGTLSGNGPPAELLKSP